MVGAQKSDGVPSAHGETTTLGARGTSKKETCRKPFSARNLPKAYFLQFSNFGSFSDIFGARRAGLIPCSDYDARSAGELPASRSAPRRLRPGWHAFEIRAGRAGLALLVRPL